MRYVESLNLALHRLMDEDERVFLLGEDIVDPYGGAFKVTKGLSTDEDVQNSVETRGSPELVVYAAWAWAGGGGDSLPSWSSNFGKCR